MTFLGFSQETILWNGEVHTGLGTVLPNTTLVLEHGKIKKIVMGHFDSTNRKVIDVSGKKVYPGFIIPNSTLGLTEIESVRGQSDAYEVGDINPNVRSIIAYNTDSDIIPTLIKNGVLMAEIAPKGEIVNGQSSVVTLSGNNWEEAAYKTDIGIHLNWPHKYIGHAWWDDVPSPRKNEKYEKQLDAINNLFNDAFHYSKIKTPEVLNLKLESMRGLFDSSKTLFINAVYSSEIIEAITLFKKLHVKSLVIVGALDSEDAIPFLSKHKIPVIFTKVHSLPSQSHSNINQAYSLPNKFKAANILYGLSYEGDMDAMGSRNLAFTAGTTVAYGVDKEHALSSITSNTAKILRIDDRCGSIEVGKDATLFVSEGDALDILGNSIIWAAIKGKVQSLHSKQDDLYLKYKK